MNEGFVDASGLINIGAGVLLLIYWYSFALFLPYGKLSSTLAILVENRNWTWINALGALGALLGLLGQAGIVVVQIEVAGWAVVTGFFVASAGTTLLIGTMLWETVLWPILVKRDPNLLSFQGPIYTSKTFLPFFILSGVIYGVGYVLVGAGLMQAGVLPSMAGLLLMIGAPVFGLGAMFGRLQVYIRSLGLTALCAGIIWLGLEMFL